MNKLKFFIFAVLFLVSLFFCRHVAAEDTKRYTLEKLIDIAVEKNPSVAVFNANLDASRGKVISSMAYPNPELELIGGKGELLEGSVSGEEHSISVGQPLEWPKKRSFRIKAAEYSREVTRLEKEIFLLELRYEVKAAFYRLILNMKEVRIARDNLKTVNELLESVKVRVEAGEAPGFELVKAQVESLKAGKELRRAEKKVLLARISLNSLLGNALPEDFEVTGEFPILREKYKKEELLSIALAKHPLVRRQKKEVEARGYALERERQSVFPDVTVQGFYARELDKKSFGVGLSVPLPFWYRKKGEITTARAEKTRAEAELQSTRVELGMLLEQAYRSYQIALDQVDVFEKGLLKQAEEALSIAEFSYRQGESGLLDYLDAQRVYRETLLEYARARFELSLSIADIERRMGGV